MQYYCLTRFLLMRQARRRVLFAAVATLFVCGACYAEPTDQVTSAAVFAEWEHPTHALSVLQKAHAADGNTLLLQGDLDFLIDDTGGGACATAAGVNLLQAMRLVAGLERLPNLHRVALAAFEHLPELRTGRVTNRQFVNLIEYLRTYLDGASVVIDTESAPNSRYSEDKRTWSELNGPDLAVTSRQVKVLSYTVTDAGKLIGRHFVLLKGQSKNEVVVVDPHDPGKERRYILEQNTKVDGAPASVFLLQPAGAPPRSRVFELNTIFKVSVASDDGRGEQRPCNGASVEFVKRKFDETATALRGTEDFLSPRVWRERTASFGLPGLDLPIAYGGSGWSATKILDVFRHAGEHNLNFRDVIGGAHVRPLLSSTHAEIQDIVRQVAKGKAYIAIAITEPSAGSDISSIQSTCRKVRGGYVLTGQKRFNARLDQATHVIIFTQGAAVPHGKLSVFVVPIDAPGLVVERLTPHGLTGNSYGGLTFTDLFVPESHLLGNDGEGWHIFFNHFLYWRLMQAATAIGTGQNAIKQMAERIKTRKAFGAPIARFTHLQQPIGQYTTELNAAYALAKEAAKLIDDGEYRGAHAMICGLKAEGVEAALRATDAATRAFGGEGYSTLIDVGDRLKDLNGLRIADGTTDVMRMEVVRRTFGEEFWEMAVKRAE